MKLSCPHCPADVEIPDWPMPFGAEDFECCRCSNRLELEWDYTTDYDVCFWFVKKPLALEETG